MPEEARRGRVEERPRWQELSKKAKQDFESKTFCFIYGKILGSGPTSPPIPAAVVMPWIKLWVQVKGWRGGGGCSMLVHIYRL